MQVSALGISHLCTYMHFINFALFVQTYILSIYANLHFKHLISVTYRVIITRKSLTSDARIYNVQWWKSVQIYNGNIQGIITERTRHKTIHITE